MEFHKFNMEFSTKEKIMKKEQDLIVSYSQKGLQRNLTNESRIYGPAVRQVYIIHYILKLLVAIHSSNHKVHLLHHENATV